MEKGYFWICFNDGSVLLVFAALITSYCTNLWHLVLVQGILTGTAIGLFCGSEFELLMTYFERNMAMATALASYCGSMGQSF